MDTVSSVSGVKFYPHGTVPIHDKKICIMIFPTNIAEHSVTEIEYLIAFQTNKRAYFGSQAMFENIILCILQKSLESVSNSPHCICRRHQMVEFVLKLTNKNVIYRFLFNKQ